jgi:hypothetical protein
VLGVGAGGLIVVTNVRTLLKSDWIAAPDDVRWVVYAVLYGLWAVSIAFAVRQYLAHRESDRRLVSA